MLYHSPSPRGGLGWGLPFGEGSNGGCRLGGAYTLSDHTAFNKKKKHFSASAAAYVRKFVYICNHYACRAYAWALISN